LSAAPKLWQRNKASGKATKAAIFLELPTLPGWTLRHSLSVLTILTAACLLPFSGRAFHMDDTLFLKAAKQVLQHPFDPYGFNVLWYTTELPMWMVTKNPPLASYYAAVVGAVAGWSERALHLAFFLPALGVVFGTYVVARRLTRFPLIAALAALLTPGFVVSACGVMGDVLMLALWVFAVALWVDGLDPENPLYLLASALLIAAAALAKYFAASLIPLLLTYSLMRTRRFGRWALYLLLPVAVLVAYQYGTEALYGRGLLWDAAEYANLEREAHSVSRLATAVIGMSFLGGCTLTALATAPLLWTRKQVLALMGVAACVGIAAGLKWMSLTPPGASITPAHWNLLSAGLALFVLCALSAIALAVVDFWRNRTADSLLLGLWVLGTFIFAGFLNWTINARSILPLIPAVGILIARRIETTKVPPRYVPALLAAAFAVSGIVSLWSAGADASWANSVRRAAFIICRENQNSTIWFEGHWGFQYYMEQAGARPIDVKHPQLHNGEIIVVPENNTNRFLIPPQMVASRDTLQVPLHAGMSTMSMSTGAAFYSSLWGPLPYAFGPALPEPYTIYHLGAGADQRH